MVERHHRHPVIDITDLIECPRQGLGVEHIGEPHVDRHFLPLHAPRRGTDFFAKPDHEAIVALGQDKTKAILLAARQPRRQAVGLIVEQADRAFDPFHRLRPNRRPAVEHPVHGRNADPRLPCNIFNSRSCHGP